MPDTTSRQWRGRSTVAVASILTLGTLGALPARASAATSSVVHETTARLPTGTALVRAAKKAMLAARSVHFVLASTAAGTTDEITADAGTSTGREVLRAGKATATILLDKHDAFFGGNASGLAKFFGMPASDVNKVGSKWVEVASGTSQYSTFQKNLLASSLPAAFLPTVKSVTVHRVRVAGKQDYRLAWVAAVSGKPFHETLDISASGPALPVSQVGTSGKDRESTTFTNWGELVHVTPPKRTIAFSKLAG
jgi:hypothetical protein